MKLEYVQPEAPASNQVAGQTDERLQGGWLLFVRVAWVVVLVLAVGLFSVSIPFTFTDAHTICVAVDCSHTSYLTPGLARELHQLGLSMDFYAYLITTWSIILEFVYIAIGVLIFWRRPDDRMALISSFTLITFGAAFRGFNPESTLSPLLYVLSLVMAFFGNCCGGLFFYLFPTGRFAPRWVGLLVLGWIIYWAINNLLLATILTYSGLDFVIFLSLLISVVATQFYRYRRVAMPLQRQQTKWVVFGISLALLGVLTVFTMATVSLSIIPFLIAGSLLYIFLLLIPLSIGIAILRYRLWDIDIIINRALVYGALTISIVGIYVLVVGYLGALFRSGSNLLISLIAAGLVAVVFQPLRERIQRVANHLLYGQRDEPYAVITGLSRRLEATLAPDAVLSTIVQTVAQALKLPYAAILLKQEDKFTIAASSGNEKEALQAFPLVYQREVVGKLLLAPRAPGEDFTPADLDLLNELTRQIGLAAYAVRLTSDLQRSNEHLQSARARLVTAREEERRRLRRDLHDGLGSALTSVTFQLDAAGNLLDRNPDAVRTLLKELKGQIQVSIADIRRLVYNLRPPILDEWGLVGAIREQVAQYELNAVRVTVEASEPFPVLPAAVEVAAYRIALEGLANVIKHAQATTCTIRLVVSDDALTVEVQDNGRGLPQNYHAGVGISAMRERAAELGGSCVVENVSNKATRVFATLPRREE
jgi:signal transduction histidine kinase